MVAALAVAACGETSVLTIDARLDEARPAIGLEITLLPVDPEALYDSLAAAAPTARPDFAALEQLITRYRIPTRRTSTTDGGWGAARDSVETLADSLRGADRTTPGYRAAYGRLRLLYDRLGQRSAARDRAERETLREDRSLADRAARAADELRRWERVAFAGYRDRLAAAVAATGREAARVATDSAGQVSITLSPGRWWLRAHQRVRDNPFQERLWNVVVTTNRLVPVRVRLTPENGTLRWRH